MEAGTLATGIRKVKARNAQLRIGNSVIPVREVKLISNNEVKIISEEEDRAMSRIVMNRLLSCLQNIIVING